MDIVLAHGGELPPPPLTPLRLLTAWSFDPWIVVPLVAAAAIYLLGVRTLRRKGVEWSRWRTVLWFIGLGLIFLATSSVVGVYDTGLFSVHSVQHLLLQMIAPAPLGMAAPIALALRTLPRRPRRVLLAVVHSRPLKLLTHPLVAYALFVVSPFVLVYSGLFEATLRSDLLHNLMHVHFVLIGCLLYWPLLGFDPLPNPMPYVFRMLLVLGLGPAHIVLGIPIMLSNEMIAADYYAELGRSWGVSPLEDQNIGGGLLRVFGDVTVLFLLGGLFAQWNRADGREARRLDRHLDRVHGEATTITPWWLQTPAAAPCSGWPRWAAGPPQRPPPD